MKKNLINKLLEKLSGADESTSEGFLAFDKGVAKLKDELKKKIQIGTLDEVNDKLDSFRKRIDLDPIIEAVNQIQNDMVSRETEMRNALEERAEEIRGELSQARGSTKDNFTVLQSELSDLESQIKELASRKPPELPDFTPQIQEVENKAMSFLDAISSDIEGIKKADKTQELEKAIENLRDELKKARIELLSRMNDRGGGNMNRQIAIGGNQSVLGKYTDINIKPGNNVTITYQNNETTKQVDVTIAASGGASTAGIVRSINTISTSQTAGEVAGTDYVYLCAQGVNLTLPTAVGNTNLYTIKNISNSSVLVSGTIDDDASGVIMPVKYTSIDIISNDTDWDIT